jgi:flagellar basal-body rod modification protein FlgD
MSSNYYTDLKGIVTTGLETAASVAKHSTSTKAGKDLQMEDFLQLMVATVQNQTIDNQADISDMMNQMVQMSVVQAISNISQLITDTTSLTYAASLVGKDVIIAEKVGNETIQIPGKVTGTGTLDGTPVIFVGDKSYWLSDVLAVGELPSKESQEQNAQALQNDEDWLSQQTTSSSMDMAARAALDDIAKLQSAKDDTVDALLEAIKPSDDDDKRANAIADFLDPNANRYDAVVNLLTAAGNSADAAAILSALGHDDIPLSVIEDAMQEIGVI